VGYLANRSGRVKYNIDPGKKPGFSANRIQPKRGGNLFLVLHIDFGETLWSAEGRHGLDRQEFSVVCPKKILRIVQKP